MIVSVLGIAAAVALALLAALHVYWAFGGRAARGSVVPTVDGRPTITPTRGATLVVALLLVVGAYLLVGAVAEWRPAWMFRVGCGGISLALLARAVGNGTTFGFAKRVRDTPFARRDSTLYSPLCLGLGISAALVALAG